jgi:DNA invertase Pin-like site-specific DNA recombinase
VVANDHVIADAATGAVEHDQAASMTMTAVHERREPAKIMLTVLGGLAEFERSLIIARTGEGRKRAQARGVKFGRPRKLTPHQRQEAIQRLDAGETQADVARTYNVDPTTIGRLMVARPFHGGESAGVQ